MNRNAANVTAAPVSPETARLAAIHTDAVKVRDAAERAMDRDPCEANGVAYLATLTAEHAAEDAWRASMPRVVSTRPHYAPRQSFAASCRSWNRR